jgi:hypothetical protein
MAYALHWERSIIHLTLVVRQTMKKQREFAKDMVIVFTDFKKA